MGQRSKGLVDGGQVLRDEGFGLFSVGLAAVLQYLLEGAAFLGVVCQAFLYHFPITLLEVWPLELHWLVHLLGKQFRLAFGLPGGALVQQLVPDDA
jgi:hypothetical protein